MVDVLGKFLPEPYISLFSGFVGALLGAGVSILTVFVQGWHQAKRERAKLAMEAAVEDSRLILEAVKNSPHTKHYVPSLSSLIYFYRDFLDLLEKKNVSHGDLVELYRSHNQLRKSDEGESNDE